MEISLRDEDVLAIILGLATHRECIEGVAQRVALTTRPNTAPTLEAATGSSQNLSRLPLPRPTKVRASVNSTCVAVFATLASKRLAH